MKLYYLYKPNEVVFVIFFLTNTMKKLVLLLFVLNTTFCVGCSAIRSDNINTKPPIEQMDNYIDFANWHKIYLKDMATAKPQIKGTFVADTTLSAGEKILVYKHITDGGVFVTKYGFDHHGLLYKIVSRLEDRSADTMTVAAIVGHSEALSFDINSYVNTQDGGRLTSFTFGVYKRENLIRGLDHDQVREGADLYAALWNFADQQMERGFEVDQAVQCTQQWLIADNVVNADGITPSTLPIVSFYADAKKRTMQVEFKRWTVIESEDNEDLLRQPLANFMYFGRWNY